jgi:putative exporter of polyketide antibiotics
MSKKSSLYGFVAAAVATVACGLVYAGATANLAALVDVGEGSAEEIRRAVAAAKFSLVALFMMAAITLAVFVQFIALRRSDVKRGSD